MKCVVAYDFGLLFFLWYHLILILFGVDLLDLTLRVLFKSNVIDCITPVMGDCRVCFEPGGVRLGCACRAFGHLDCILRACKARYEATSDKNDLIICDVCHTSISNFAVQLAQQAHDTIGSKDTRLYLAVVAHQCGSEQKVELNRDDTDPLNIFMCGFHDLMKTDTHGDATEAYLRLHRDVAGKQLYMKYMLQTVIKYTQSGNNVRGKAICHEMHQLLGDNPDRRDPRVLIMIACISASACVVDAPFVISLQSWRKNMVGVLGPNSRHTLNFDTGIVLAHLQISDYKSALPKIISILRRQRESLPKHHKETLVMTRWLARTYCELGQADKAKPHVKYLMKQKFSFTDSDVVVFFYIFSLNK